MVFCVGLTGGIGSGKSTAASLLESRGAAVIDADRFAHQLTGVEGRGLPQIVAAFGPRVLSADGAMDRSVVRQLVFSDAGARKRLESILHPLIYQDIVAALEALDLRRGYAILMVPLLAESVAYQKMCRWIVSVECSVEIQIRRVMERSRLSREEVMKVIAAQSGPAQRMAIANEIISNSGSLEDLERAVSALHLRLNDLAGAR